MKQNTIQQKQPVPAVTISYFVDHDKTDHDRHASLTGSRADSSTGNNTHVETGRVYIIDDFENDRLHGKAVKDAFAESCGSVKPELISTDFSARKNNAALRLVIQQINAGEKVIGVNLSSSSDFHKIEIASRLGVDKNTIDMNKLLPIKSKLLNSLKNDSHYKDVVETIKLLETLTSKGVIVTIPAGNEATRGDKAFVNLLSMANGVITVPACNADYSPVNQFTIRNKCQSGNIDGVSGTSFAAPRELGSRICRR